MLQVFNKFSSRLASLTFWAYSSAALATWQCVQWEEKAKAFFLQSCSSCSESHLEDILIVLLDVGLDALLGLDDAGQLFHLSLDTCDLRVHLLQGGTAEWVRQAVVGFMMGKTGAWVCSSTTGWLVYRRAHRKLIMQKFHRGV